MKYLLSEQKCDELRKKCYEKLLSKRKVYPLENDIPKSWLKSLRRCDDKGRVPLIYYTHDVENEYQLFVVYVTYEDGGFLSTGRSLCWSRSTLDIKDVKILINDFVNCM